MWTSTGSVGVTLEKSEGPPTTGWAGGLKQSLKLPAAKLALRYRQSCDFGATKAVGCLTSPYGPFVGSAPPSVLASRGVRGFCNFRPASLKSFLLGFCSATVALQSFFLMAGVLRS